MRCCRLLLAVPGWTPASLQHLPEAPVPQKKLRPRQHQPLSLAAREQMSQLSLERKYHVVTQDWFGERVDDFVLKHHPEWSLDTVKKLVEQGQIYRYRRNGKRRYTRVTDRLEFDELVAVPTAGLWPSQIRSESTDEPEEVPEERVGLSAAAREMAHKMVLFKNEHVIVINKPPNVPMMPKDATELSIHGLLPAWKFTNDRKPLICHNLDRETSGCVVLARTRSAHRMLGRMFVKRVVPNSVYWGFLVGKPSANVGRIRMHLERTRGDGGDVVVVRPKPTTTSRVAIAEYVVNASALEFGSFVSFYPLTTRTHQLRIMAAHALRCPVLGDAKFGGTAAFPQSLSMFWDPEDRGLPLHMHHRKIQLPYKNQRGEFESITAPLPAAMEQTFKKLGWPTDADDPLIP